MTEKIPPSGFSFDGSARMSTLLREGCSLPCPRNTGTTIAGIVYKEGVILGADTRATEESIVSDTKCIKIHKLSSNIFACGAGIASDSVKICKHISCDLELQELDMERIIPVSTANQLMKRLLFRFEGHISAAFVLGGVDHLGPHLYSIYAQGSSDQLPFTSMGSGCLSAMAVLESRWKRNMEEFEGMELVSDSIVAGIMNDLGSGNNVDLCVIRSNTYDVYQPYRVANVKGERHSSYRFETGTTDVLVSKTIPIVVDEMFVKCLSNGGRIATPTG